MEVLDRSRRSGATLGGVAVAIAAAGLVAVCALAAMRDPQAQARASVCRNHLHQLHLTIRMYCNDYGDFLPAFWHERWVAQCGLVGRAWGDRPHDRDKRVPLVWEHSSPIAEFPLRTGAPFLTCPADPTTWRCDQGCHVSYMGLAKYGWWHGALGKGDQPRYMYRQVHEVERPSGGLMLAETRPGTFQYGSCGCRWFVSRHPVRISPRHEGGGNILHFDGSAEYVEGEKDRSIAHWEPDYERVNPGY